MNDGRRNKNDAVSVNMWVEEQANLGITNSVLYYKNQGNEDGDILKESDFCLIIMNQSQQYMLNKFGNNIICIDSTHGLNKYDFELSTLMVIDEFGEGFPCAFMFTNRKDTNIFKFFFMKVKEKVGTILTKTFMTDITSVFFNAWCEVMGPPEHQLYCAWHIDRAWQKNLNKIKKSEKRDQVYKILKYLQNFKNENNFQEELHKAIHFFTSDVETESFGNYFKINYSQQFKLWASCYRKECHINSNMHLEAAHKTIKYCYLNGTTVQRLDKGLNAVMKYVRDKTVQRIIKHKKGKYSSKKIYNPVRINDENEITVHLESCYKPNIVANVSSFEDDITRDFNEIIRESKNITDLNLLQQCRDHIKKARLLLKVGLSNDIEEPEIKKNKVNGIKTHEPSNKKINKQLSFFSTKRKKKKSNVKKPTNDENLIIHELLHNDPIISNYI